MPDPLKSIPECPEIYYDAALTDPVSGCWLLSVWGRDTAIQEFRGRLSLGRAEGGLQTLTLHQCRVLFPKPESLKCLTGRVGNTMFGELVHAWVYHPLLEEPDPATRQAVILHNDRTPAALLNHLWNAVNVICPIPLLPHWQSVILDLFTESGWITPCHGMGIEATFVDLNHDTVGDLLSDAIRSGQLTLTPSKALQQAA